MSPTHFDEGPKSGEPSARWAGPALGLALAAAILAGIALAGRLAAARDPLRRAWSAAQAAGSYAVGGTTRATTEAGVAEHVVTGTGSAAGVLDLVVRPAAGPAASVTYRIAWPAVDVLDGSRDAGTTVFDPHALALALPAGDPLALLAVGHGAAVGEVEITGGRACRKAAFQIGAEAYEPWWRDHPYLLPANADSGGLHKLSGTGTLWVDPDGGLPCRIAARLDLPRLGGDQPGIGEVDWSYRDWGIARPAVSTREPQPSRTR